MRAEPFDATNNNEAPTEKRKQAASFIINGEIKSNVNIILRIENYIGSVRFKAFAKRKYCTERFVSGFGKCTKRAFSIRPGKSAEKILCRKHKHRPIEVVMW